jgi:hypothetical protein
MPDARRTAEQQTGQRYVSEDVASLRALTGQIRDPLVRGYVEESILCLEVEALRAAIVFLWTAAIRELREAAWSRGGRVVNPAIKKQDARARTIKKADDFAYVTDRAFLDASPSMGGLLDKGQKDTLVEALTFAIDAATRRCTSRVWTRLVDSSGMSLGSSGSRRGCGSRARFSAVPGARTLNAAGVAGGAVVAHHRVAVAAGDDAASTSTSTSTLVQVQDRLWPDPVEDAVAVDLEAVA